MNSCWKKWTKTVNSECEMVEFEVWKIIHRHGLLSSDETTKQKQMENK